jgi:hypothetical protein
MKLGKAILDLFWVPLVIGHAIWAWYTSNDLSTYWMLCVCALSVAYVIQWVIFYLKAQAPQQTDES